MNNDHQFLKAFVCVLGLFLLTSCSSNIVGYKSIGPDENLFFGRLIYGGGTMGKDAWRADAMSMTVVDGDGKEYPLSTKETDTRIITEKGNYISLFSLKTASKTLKLKQVALGRSNIGYIFNFANPPTITVNGKGSVFYMGDYLLGISGNEKDSVPRLRIGLADRGDVTLHDFAGLSGLQKGTLVKGKSFPLKGLKYRVTRREVVYHYTPGFVFIPHHHR